MNKLGRGLSALIPDKNDKKIPHQKQNIKLNLSDIHPGKFQHRVDFKDEKLQELADSIRSNGVIQPILVRKRKNLQGYEIIAGERRWRASSIAGLEDIPAIILEVSDKTALEVSIIENIQRDDFNVIEEAHGYKNLIDEFCYKQEELAKVVGKSRSHIANCIRILSLPDEIQQLLIKGSLTMGHARVLVGVENNIVIARHIVERSLNVRQTEALKKGKKINIREESRDEDIILLEKTMSEKIGLDLKVQINDNKKNGAVIMRFNNLEELRSILEKLKVLIK